MDDTTRSLASANGKASAAPCRNRTPTSLDSDASAAVGLGKGVYASGAGGHAAAAGPGRWPCGFGRWRPRRRRVERRRACSGHGISELNAAECLNSDVKANALGTTPPPRPRPHASRDPLPPALPPTPTMALARYFQARERRLPPGRNMLVSRPPPNQDRLSRSLALWLTDADDVAVPCSHGPRHRFPVGINYGRGGVESSLASRGIRPCRACVSGAHRRSRRQRRRISTRRLRARPRGSSPPSLVVLAAMGFASPRPTARSGGAPGPSERASAVRTDSARRRERPRL